MVNVAVLVTVGDVGAAWRTTMVESKLDEVIATAQNVKRPE